ncbi:MAG: hypothetical protein ACE15C_10660 [Phycisphaerae bacterium]
MTAIPTPPMPQMPQEVSGFILYGACAGAAVVALVLLLWGRTLGRVVLALAAAGAGVMLGGPLAVLLKAPPMVGQVALGITACALGLVLARPIWALFAAGLFESLALALIVSHYLGVYEAKNVPEFKLPEDVNTFVAWLAAFGTFSLEAFDKVREANLGTLMIITVPAGLLPLLIALMRPKTAAIFSSSILGGVLMTAALWLAAINVRPSLWPEDWWRFLIPTGVAVVLAIIGWVYQGHGELAAQREAAKKREEATPPKKKDEDRAYIPGQKKA